MVNFQTEDPNSGKFGRPLERKRSVYYIPIRYILRPFGIVHTWPFGIVHCHFVYFMAYWYILWPIGIFHGHLVT
jgi:hypothetical protein